MPKQKKRAKQPVGRPPARMRIEASAKRVVDFVLRTRKPPNR